MAWHLGSHLPAFGRHSPRCLPCPVAVPACQSTTQRRCCDSAGRARAVVSYPCGARNLPEVQCQDQEPKGLPLIFWKPQGTTWAGKFSTGHQWLSPRSWADLTAHLWAHSIRGLRSPLHPPAHCSRHREILKGMLAIVCKPRPPSQHRRQRRGAKTEKNPG